jgi:hypothetical protein
MAKTPHYPKGDITVHGDPRISYHGTRDACEKRIPELAMLAEAHGLRLRYTVERCARCRAWVVRKERLRRMLRS